MSTLSTREKILGRIREALSVPSPKPGHGTTERISGNGAPPSSRAREWLPRTGTTAQEHMDLFLKTAVDLKAEVVIVDNRVELSLALRKMRDEERWKLAGVHSGKLTDFAAAELNINVLRVDNGYEVPELEKADVGFTQCDALVAQTGSVLVTARSAGGRALSALPPHHVVLASARQLVPDLPEAMALLKREYGKAFPSFISFITGPSRTGDIERILVLGAHGPKRLTIFILSEEA